jgi:membrane-bound serine protease (ClpP class)
MSLETDRPTGIRANGFLNAIAQPVASYSLLGLGSVALLIELAQPGLVVPGVVAAICLLLVFAGLGTLPLNFAGASMLALAFLLLGLQPFLGGLGLFGVGAALAFLIGIVLLAELPETASFTRSSRALAGSLTHTIALFGRGSADPGARRPVGHEALIGSCGVARTYVGAQQPGLVMTHGELWQAVASGTPIAAGDPVEVDRIDGLLLTVHGVPADGPAQRDLPTPPSFGDGIRI